MKTIIQLEREANARERNARMTIGIKNYAKNIAYYGSMIVIVLVIILGFMWLTGIHQSHFK